MKNVLKIFHSVNPLNLITDRADGYIEEKNGDKYLILFSTGKIKKVLRKYTKLWNGIKNLIEKYMINQVNME